MTGAKFVHVITLVGTGAGIEKRIITSDKESGLVVTYGVWTGKYGTSLTVFELAVATDERVGSCKSTSNDAGLADVAGCH